MRFTALILALLVLVLHCIPCGDAPILPAGTGETSLMAAVPEQDHDTGPDLCSPFCSCSCCASCAVPVDYPEVPAPIVFFIRKAFLHHPPQPLAEAYLPVWQPPQLV